MSNQLEHYKPGGLTIVYPAIERSRTCVACLPELMAFREGEGISRCWRWLALVRTAASWRSSPGANFRPESFSLRMTIEHAPSSLERNTFRGGSRLRLWRILLLQKVVCGLASFTGMSPWPALTLRNARNTVTGPAAQRDRLLGHWSAWVSTGPAAQLHRTGIVPTRCRKGPGTGMPAPQDERCRTVSWNLRYALLSVSDQVDQQYDETGQQHGKDEEIAEDLDADLAAGHLITPHQRARPIPMEVGPHVGSSLGEDRACDTWPVRVCADVSCP